MAKRRKKSKIKSYAKNTVSFFTDLFSYKKEGKRLLFSTAILPKLLYAYTLVPIPIFLSGGAINTPKTIIGTILLVIGYIIMYAYFTAELVARYILYDNEKIIQKGVFVYRQEILVADITRCRMIYGMSRKEKRGYETLRIETTKGRMDINPFYFKKKRLREMLLSLGLTPPGNL